MGRRRQRRWGIGKPAVNHASTAGALRTFARHFPGAPALAFDRVWACYLDVTPDMLPSLGPVDGIDGLVVATGMSGHGFGLGPIAGRIAADAALGTDPGFDLRAFDVRRYARGDFGLPVSIG